MNDLRWGTFIGDIEVRWLDDGRRMMLLKPVRFIDPHGVEWRVPDGYVTNGISMPRIFWTISGGPYIGPSRMAAVFHDWYCDNRPVNRSSVEVHRMFYYASRAGGLDPVRAWIRWAAVRVFGPRWRAR